MFPPTEKLPSPMEQKRILEPMIRKVEQQGFCVSRTLGIDPNVISRIRKGAGIGDLRSWRVLKHLLGDD
jgi:hypothetical protein